MKEKQYRINKNSITKRLQEENKFIIDICRLIPGMYLSDPCPKDAAGNIKPFKMFGTEKRATSLEDLQRKLQEWKGKRLGFMSRRVKKTIKNKIDKNKKKNARRMKKNLIKGSKDLINDVKPSSESTIPDNKPTISDNKPTVPDNKPTSGPQEGNMVFSKFDFVESIADQPEEKRKKVVKDPRKLLKMLEKQNEVIEKLKESGDIEKATSIKKKQAWKTALDRSQGIKVKDDPKLLEQTMKTKERKKRKSKREWAERNKQVEQKMRQKQEKREANIQKKQQQKKTRKIEKLVKRGRLIPGYSKFE